MQVVFQVDLRFVRSGHGLDLLLVFVVLRVEVENHLRELRDLLAHGGGRMTLFCELRYLLAQGQESFKIVYDPPRKSVATLE